MIDPAALVAARSAKEWSQPDLAKAAGCSQQLIAALERGTTRTTKFLPKIAAALEVEPGVLDSDWIGIGTPTVPEPKFIKNRSFKFYVKEWREFMGVRVAAAARAAGMGLDEYEAFETYPINFGLAQIVALADEFGIRGDQFWFPPPAKVPVAAVTNERRKTSRGRK